MLPRFSRQALPPSSPALTALPPRHFAPPPSTLQTTSRAPVAVLAPVPALAVTPATPHTSHDRVHCAGLGAPSSPAGAATEQEEYTTVVLCSDGPEFTSPSPSSEEDDDLSDFDEKTSLPYFTRSSIPPSRRFLHPSSSASPSRAPPAPASAFSIPSRAGSPELDPPLSTGPFRRAGCATRCGTLAKVLALLLLVGLGVGLGVGLSARQRAHHQHASPTATAVAADDRAAAPTATSLGTGASTRPVHAKGQGVASLALLTSPGPARTPAATAAPTQTVKWVGVNGAAAQNGAGGGVFAARTPGPRERGGAQKGGVALLALPRARAGGKKHGARHGGKKEGKHARRFGER
ncbi:hypothetical protein JCM10207_008628 [Rhodosporidiobolus poonsookiae]